jgi:hypothetical protein
MRLSVKIIQLAKEKARIPEIISKKADFQLNCNDFIT